MLNGLEKEKDQSCSSLSVKDSQNNELHQFSTCTIRKHLLAMNVWFSIITRIGLSVRRTGPSDIKDVRWLGDVSL